jgi:hypothetical protein
MALLLPLSVAGGLAAEETDCRAIEDPNERLACFDATYGTADAAPEAAEATAVESETVIVSEPVVPAAPESLEPSPAAAAPAAAPLVSESPEGSSPAEEKKTGFLGDELVDFTSPITAILAGEKQKMVFQLENEQIWLQSSPRRLPFKEGDVVRIKNATLGGYIMRSEKGVSTRVSRIH